MTIARSMGRDMTATGRCAVSLQPIIGIFTFKHAALIFVPWLRCRYPPVPKYPPIAFYSAIRLGDPEQLAKVMDTDPYFITQDNGAGAPVHFATTYKQLDMVRAVSQQLRLIIYSSIASYPAHEMVRQFHSCRNHLHLISFCSCTIC
jgi:hypothetical protein